jgi:hypothetical protein
VIEDSSTASDQVPDGIVVDEVRIGGEARFSDLEGGAISDPVFWDFTTDIGMASRQPRDIGKVPAILLPSIDKGLVKRGS